MFDFNKVKDFDMHIRLSIPNYEQLFNTFSSLTSIYSEPDSCVIDYGCSTGKLLIEIQKKKDCQYFGVDESSLIPAIYSGINFVKQDAITFGKNVKCNVSVIISMFFLQFLSKLKRKEMLTIMRKQVEAGAILLVSEKIMLPDNKIDNIISRLHIAEKRNNFSDKEILDKDIQLLDSMYILEETELVRELSSIGNVIKIWQSYNFVGYVVKK